jgi:hypothetical protein
MNKWLIAMLQKGVVRGCKNASMAKSQEHLKYKETLGKDVH